MVDQASPAAVTEHTGDRTPVLSGEEHSLQRDAFAVPSGRFDDFGDDTLTGAGEPDMDEQIDGPGDEPAGGRELPPFGALPRYSASFVHAVNASL